MLGGVVEPMDYQELVLGLVLGSISGFLVGFFVEYLHHYFSGKRSKEEVFLPYLRKLHGSISEIMKNTEAEELGKRYDRLINARIEEKMRESAIRELGAKEHVEIPEYMKPAFSALLIFLSSYNSIVEVIRECKRFESVYTEMEEKGLIATLKVHHGRLYNRLSFFHGSASYIVEETSDIVDNLVKASELKEGQTIFEDDIFGTLRRINTHNLFLYGSEVQQQLKKRV